MSKPTIKSLTAQLAKNGRIRERIKARDGRMVDAYHKRLEHMSEPTIKASLKDDERIAKQLKTLNPFQVKSRIQIIGPDGLPTANVYEVTRVVDHQALYARQVTARGGLGKEAFYFKRGRHSWEKGFDLDKVSLVEPVKLAKKKGEKGGAS